MGRHRAGVTSERRHREKILMSGEEVMENWKANVILSPVTNWIYILDGLPVHTQYFAGARNKMQTL